MLDFSYITYLSLKDAADHKLPLAQILYEFVTKVTKKQRDVRQFKVRDVVRGVEGRLADMKLLAIVYSALYRTEVGLAKVKIAFPPTITSVLDDILDAAVLCAVNVLNGSVKCKKSGDVHICGDAAQHGGLLLLFSQTRDYSEYMFIVATSGEGKAVIHT